MRRVFLTKVKIVLFSGIQKMGVLNLFQKMGVLNLFYSEDAG